MKISWLWSIVTGGSIVGIMATPLLAQTPTDPNTDRFPQGIPAPTPLPPDPKPTPTVEPVPEATSIDDKKSVLVNNIEVVGSTVIAKTSWESIVRSSVGKTLTIGELKKTADRLTDRKSVV